MLQVKCFCFLKYWQENHRGMCSSTRPRAANGKPFSGPHSLPGNPTHNLTFKKPGFISQHTLMSRLAYLARNIKLTGW